MTTHADMTTAPRMSSVCTTGACLSGAISYLSFPLGIGQVCEEAIQ
jgi:hypothetical protein